ncbi:MAG: hypothetical protein ACRC68_08260 [Clostridium sp.]
MTNKKLKTIDRFNPIIRKFSPEYEFLTDNFNSGEFAFDNFIKSSATTDCQNGDGVTYIVIDELINNAIIINQSASEVNPLYGLTSEAPY